MFKLRAVVVSRWSFFIGLIALLCMFFDYWSEVFFPVQSRMWDSLSVLAMATIYMAGILAVAAVVMAYTSASSSTAKATACINVVLWVLLVFAVQFRFAFFGLGARSRVYYCGGADTIRQAALYFLESPTEPQENEVFAKRNMRTLNALAGGGSQEVTVVAHKEAAFVEIVIPQRRNISDQFCYVVTKTKGIACPLPAWQTWQIDNSLFFCQKP